MKSFWISFSASSILIGLLLALLPWSIFPQKEATSPLPEFLTLAKNDQVSTISLFLPAVKEVDANVEAPLIQAKSALIYDLTTNKTLFAKDPNKKLPIASLTKVMTGAVALENKKQNDKYLVTKENLVGENSMGVSIGETLSLKDLLYGLILVSGNDAAEVLANNFSTGREGFIKAMNDKAKSLGLKNTSFTNPSGLEGDGDQYSTASDLLVITNFALSNFSEFRDVVKTVSYYIPSTDLHKEFFLENETNLLTSYPGVKGVKTGYTPEAGLCLITYLEYGGHRIIGVLLGSNNRRDDMKELLDYSLRSLGITPPLH